MGNSKIKRMLGLKVNTPPAGISPVRERRQMTLAEIMRQQMGVEQIEGGLRETLKCTMVGQIGRKADIIVDTNENSDAMNSLINCINNPAWKTQTECHWADGYPLNMHLYLALLQSIFDLKEETLMLDEVDELVELMKSTWPSLGINKAIHNVCLAWVLFQQYVITGQIEPDLLSATQAMVTEVSIDAKNGEKDSCYMKVLSRVMASMQGWVEKKLMQYHESFKGGSVYGMEAMLSLALTAGKIIEKDVPSGTANMSGNRMDDYIRTSMRSAFSKILENSLGVNRTMQMVIEEEQDSSTILTQVANATEQLAIFEKETYSPILRRWGSHPAPTTVAVMTLHNCFGIVLKQYLAKVTSLTNELVRVIRSAREMEKTLIDMAVEDSGKGIVKEMMLSDVESVVAGLLKNWIEERLRFGREFLIRTKETESWAPKSLTSERYASSGVELMKLVMVTMEEFLKIPVRARNEMVEELAEGLGTLIQDYTSLVASTYCSTKWSRIDPLTPLTDLITECTQESRLKRFFKKILIDDRNNSFHNTKGKITDMPTDGQNLRRTSRRTQRLYVRINTLYYIIDQLSAHDESLASFSNLKNVQSTTHAHLPNYRGVLAPFSHHFELALTAVQSATQQLSEAVADCLIFSDLHDIDDVAYTRNCPRLNTLKKNLSFLVYVLTERAQPLAVKEVMKASYDAFLLDLIEGSDRFITLPDHKTIEEEFKSLKSVFCTFVDGLIAEELVDKEAEVVEGIIELMSKSTERLIEEFSIAACKANRLGRLGAGLGSNKWELGVVPMSPANEKWNPPTACLCFIIHSEPNTILRVLCLRNDDVANQFLKMHF
ncbi:hypothetical protein LUZ60_014949 [Juncus effusus]|nr:hypothetical protein LUZ60_014949 [Juncus effusus]